MSYFKRAEDFGIVLDNRIHGIGNTKSMRPVVVRNPSVVFANCQTEPDETVLVKSRQTEEVHEHVYRMTNLVKFVQIERRKVKTEK